jgi:stage III sporulation protein AF
LPYWQWQQDVPVEGKGEDAVDFLYDWVKNIAIFLLLVSIIRNLLPQNHYDKYVRLFTGLMTVLLVLQPLSGLLGIQEQVDTLFSLDIYSQEMEAVKADFLQAGEGFEDSLLEAYEAQMKQQVELLLKEEGLTAASILFYIGTDEAEETYGSITRMEIYLGEEETQNETPSIPTPQIGYDTEETQEAKDGFLSAYPEIEKERIAQKLCDYYHLEREQVEIYG